MHVARTRAQAMLQFGKESLDRSRNFKLLTSALNDPKDKIKTVALEGMAVLAKGTSSGEFNAMLGRSGLPEAQKQQVLQRLANPALPTVNMDGLVEHVVEMPFVDGLESISADMPALRRPAGYASAASRLPWEVPHPRPRLRSGVDPTGVLDSLPDQQPAPPSLLAMPVPAPKIISTGPASGSLEHPHRLTVLAGGSSMFSRYGSGANSAGGSPASSSPVGVPPSAAEQLWSPSYASGVPGARGSRAAASATSQQQQLDGSPDSGTSTGAYEPSSRLRNSYNGTLLAQASGVCACVCVLLCTALSCPRPTLARRKTLSQRVAQRGVQPVCSCAWAGSCTGPWVRDGHSVLALSVASGVLAAPAGYTGAAPAASAGVRDSSSANISLSGLAALKHHRELVIGQ